MPGNRGLLIHDSCSDSGSSLSALLSSDCSPSSAGCPVRARNASSSVGRRSAISSTAIAAARRSPATRARGPSTSPGAGIEIVRCSGYRRHLERRDSAAGSALERGASAATTSIALRADLRLQLRGGAGGDLAAVVDQHDAVGERVGLLQVLRRQQQRDPVGDELADRRPHDLAAARIEAGRRLVEDEQLRPSIRPAARSTRRRSPPDRCLDEPVRELARRRSARSALRRSPVPRGGAAAQPRHQHEVLARREVLCRAPRTARSARSRCGPARLRRRCRAGDRALPPSGRNSVASIRTVVVLPAPFGPSSDTTVPGSTCRSSAVDGGEARQSASSGPWPRSRQVGGFAHELDIIQ